MTQMEGLYIMSRLFEIMERRNAGLIKEAADQSDSLLVKVASGLETDSLMALLGPVFQASPPSNMDQIKELLGQLIQGKIQASLTAMEMNGEADPLEIQRKKIERMVDITRGRLRLAELQKDLIDKQQDLASKMQANAAMKAAMQMPMMGGQPPVPPPIPSPGGPAPGMMMPGMAPPPGASPGAPPGAPPVPPKPPAVPVPESPMAAASK